MRVRRFADPAAFLAEAEPRLVAREAFFNLPLAIARTCVEDPTRYPGPNYFAVIDDADDGSAEPGVAVMTPPHPVQAYIPAGPAVAALAADLAGGGWTSSGVGGPVATADAFAAAWCAPRGLRPRVHMDLRAFELTAVVPPPAPPGRMRAATDADAAFVEGAYRAFHVETRSIGGTPPEELARRALRGGRVVVWDDGGPVAQAAVVGRTPHGARVGAVWTPPDRRRRGYATALVAALSQRLLDEGARFAFLFTDLANPVSNSIYPKVGYRPIGDFRAIAFEPA